MSDGHVRVPSRHTRSTTIECDRASVQTARTLFSCSHRAVGLDQGESYYSQCSKLCHNTYIRTLRVTLSSPCSRNIKSVSHEPRQGSVTVLFFYMLKTVNQDFNRKFISKAEQPKQPKSSARKHDEHHAHRSICLVSEIKINCCEKKRKTFKAATSARGPQQGSRWRCIRRGTAPRRRSSRRIR